MPHKVDLVLQLPKPQIISLDCNQEEGKESKVFDAKVP